MPKNLFEKIWDAHFVARRMDGRDLIYIDRHVLHELHAPHAFEQLAKQGRKVPRPDLTFSMRDHTVSTTPGRTDESNPSGAAFLRAELSLPTGDDRDFAGEPSWTLAWALIARAHLPAGIVLAGTAGIRLRGAEVIIANRLVSDELFGGAGVLVPLPAIRPLWCDPEQLKLTAEITGILGNDVGGDRGPSPVEVRAGFVGTPRPGFLIGVRGGAGLGDQIGAPTWRATLELTYRP